jgi:hypothetical protein
MLCCTPEALSALEFTTFMLNWASLIETHLKDPTWL